MQLLVQLAVALTLLTVSHAQPRAHQPQECLDQSYQGLGGSLFPSTFRIGPSTEPIVTPIATKVTTAKQFNITYFDTYKLLTNTQDPNNTETYALYQCGVLPPDASSLPKGTKLFSIPLTSVDASDSSGIAFMKLLGVQDRIAYVSSFAVDPCMQSLASCGNVDQYSSGNSTLLAAMQKNVDAIMSYQVDPNNTVSIALTAAADRGALARAEWVKFVSAFFNMEDRANSLYANITQSYKDTVTATASAAGPVSAASRPLVAWLYWNPPAFGESVQISFALFKQQYAEDAGGRMLDLKTVTAIAAKYDRNAAFQIESVVMSNMTNAGAFLREALADVDVLIDNSQYYVNTTSSVALANQDITLDTLLKTYRFNQNDTQTLKFFKNNMVIRTDATTSDAGSTDWLEMGVARPDLVLRELAGIITPSAVPGLIAAQNTYLRRLGTQPARLLAASNCNVKLTACSFPLTPICPVVYKACGSSNTLVAANPDNRCAAPICPAQPPAAPLAAQLTGVRYILTLAVAGAALLAAVLL